MTFTAILRFPRPSGYLTAFTLSGMPFISDSQRRRDAQPMSLTLALSIAELWPEGERPEILTAKGGRRVVVETIVTWRTRAGGYWVGYQLVLGPKDKAFDETSLAEARGTRDRLKAVRPGIATKIIRRTVRTIRVLPAKKKRTK